MALDFRNVNTLWSSVLVETLSRLGLKTAIVCPGSRSSPVAIAFARHGAIEAIPILDERSAAFFALGIAKQTGLPVVLVCTSGTAGANFYPAIAEARESRVSLLILTADRPPELRHCHAGQTIDQVKLFGHYPNWQSELALPSSDIGMLSYLRQTIIHAWERTLFPTMGVVHLNLPFREPLAPILDSNINAIASELDVEDFFSQIISINSKNSLVSLPLEQWQASDKPPASLRDRGIIIVGVVHSCTPQEYCMAIARLSRFLGYPVLAEALSPIRNYAALNPYLITTYDLILRNREFAQKLIPEIVIQFGELPTSKELRNWLEIGQPTRWIVDKSADNFDPLHGKTIHLRAPIQQFLELSSNSLENSASNYLKTWLEIESKIKNKIEKIMRSQDNIFEAKVAWLLSQTLPSNTSIFIANSMSVRNAEFFWMPSNSGIATYFNRGANGIDGTLSTALGIAHRDRSSVLLTGDLALLHDTNGFLIGRAFSGHLTIILINNNGGGIFEMLPISQFEPPFEEFFATPQNINFAKLCATYDVEYQFITTWEELEKLVKILPDKGIRLLEVKCDRKNDSFWLKENLKQFAQNLDLTINI
jgi:2-succinyl-5-enolpyruvyl-6-hydroxy-3-cyclohexene-1-carboxylate synthase